MDWNPTRDTLNFPSVMSHENSTDPCENAPKYRYLIYLDEWWKWKGHMPNHFWSTIPQSKSFLSYFFWREWSRFSYGRACDDHHRQGMFQYRGTMCRCWPLKAHWINERPWCVRLTLLSLEYIDWSPLNRIKSKLSKENCTCDILDHEWQMRSRTDPMCQSDIHMCAYCLVAVLES